MAMLNNPQAQQRKCDDWNKRHPVGQKVTVKLDDGGTLKTKTRGPAELLCGHSAVVWLEGFTACYLLSRVTATEGEAVHG